MYQMTGAYEPMNEVEILEFIPHRKNGTFQGFVKLRFQENGMELNGLGLHNDGKRSWLQLPAKPYKKGGGATGWNYIISFADKKDFNNFQKVTLKALDAFREGEGWRENNYAADGHGSSGNECSAAGGR